VARATLSDGTFYDYKPLNSFKWHQDRLRKAQQSMSRKRKFSSNWKKAKFLCVTGGFEENADMVGAINVLRAGHARFACAANGAVMPPAEGTHRSDLRYGSVPRLSAVEISGLQAWEDVKISN
jgi:transposase